MILRIGSRGKEVEVLQTKLNDLGIDSGKTDGIFGALTDTAVKELQRIFNLVVDGIVGKATYTLLDNLDKIKHFKLDEFRCKHCKELKLDINLLLKLEDLRKALGNKPVIVTSGYRCKYYNTYVGGIPKSEHLKGKAADIQIRGMTPTQIYNVADKVFDKGGVILYKTFVHCDTGNRYRGDRTK